MKRAEMMVRTLAGAVLLSWCLIAPAQAQDASMMVGNWFGQDTVQKPGYLKQWITRFAADGGYVTEFQTYDHCALIDRSRYEGRWTLEGNIRVMQLANYNGQPQKSITRYEVSELTPELQTYREVTSALAFVSKRVDDHFQFPGCVAQ
jgi:hypothetical protein